MASSDKGALEVHLSLEQGIEVLNYFQNRFPLDNLIEDSERNKFLSEAILARLMNQPTNNLIPLDLRCTPFQRIAWKTIERIPFGETKTYGEIARLMGKQGGARAVGQAMNKNPLPIIFP